MCAGPKPLVSEGQVLTTSGILKGNHLALKGKVQARSTYRTLTLLTSICSGLSALWYGVVTGSCLETQFWRMLRQCIEAQHGHNMTCVLP